MLRIKTAASEDMQLILNLAETAFMKNGALTRFDTLFPKLYSPQSDSAASHRILYQDDEPAGLYCLQISEADVSGVPLRIGMLGTVCVDPKFQGRGFLEILMNDALKIASEAECDLVSLGGQRQRYERFGFAPAGTHWKAVLTPRNTRGLSKGELSIVSLAQEQHLLHLAHELYKQETVSCRRGNDRQFFEVLQSRRSTPYAIMHGKEFAGYFTLSHSDSTPVITELVLPDAKLLPAFALSVCELVQNDIQILIYPWQHDIAAYFAKTAEQCICAANHKYRILNWASVITACLALRKDAGLSDAVPDWSLMIDRERVIRFSASGVSESSADCENPDVSVSLCALDATRFLFSADSCLFPQAKSAPGGLFPLPLGFSWCDAI